jgi:hypothetical protein
MALIPHDHYRAGVSADPATSSPAPIAQGPIRGYFDDNATRLLLGLSPNDSILHSGTYGHKELSVLPIKFSSIRPSMYDPRLLPFTPRLHSFLSHAIDMHEQRGQFPVYAQTRRNLDESLTWSMLKAQVACNQASISLPNYALALIPRLRYNAGGDGNPFPYQFLVFFSPSAKRIRGVRIGRVRAVLDAASNAAHAFINGPGNWPIGEPVGISIDVTELSEDDRQLLTAYLVLGVPVEGELAKGLDPTSFSLEAAREIVIGKALGKSALVTKIPLDSPGFNPDSGTDEDALDFAALDPDYEEHGFDGDGLVMTHAQAQEVAALEFMEEFHGQQEEDHPMEEDPAPPYVPAEPEAGTAFATSALQVSLDDPAGSTPPLALTPTSAVDSIPSSEAVSAASSSAPDIAAPRARRSTVGARRSRNYQGPYVQPTSSSSSSQSRRPPSRRSPSPRRYSPPRHAMARPYLQTNRYPPRRSPSPGYRHNRQRSPPPAATTEPYRGRGLPNTSGVRIIQTREQHRIVQDTDTGISALVPVMQVSSSQMGLDLSALMQPVIPEGPRGRLGPQGYAPPHSIESSRNSSGARYYPRSRSPRREPYSRPQSPSPRRSDYGSSYHSSRSGSRRSPPRRFNPPRRRSPKPPSQRWQNEDPTQDPLAVWGETTTGMEPDLGTSGDPSPSMPVAATSVPSANLSSTPGAGPSTTK